jgi:alkanesulfonate monooxygenase SsuD/methylene tetrahydromethanopterin reductase-like flavin-dependent oxidoreductase (luciferase family)
VKYSLSLLNFDYMGDLNVIADLAVEAEKAGWDAVFLSDHVNWPDMDTAGFHLGGHYVDPWIALGLIADRTDRILIGTAVTPLARRRPTKLAREILTLHHFSGGRFVLGAGSGIWPTEFDDFGDADDLKVRAEMLDEGLELLQKTWNGDDFDHRGTHYQARGRTICSGGTVVPIWVAASWPSKRPFRRAAQYDGVMVMNTDYANSVSVHDVKVIKNIIAEHRHSEKPFNLGVALNSTDNLAADVERAEAYEAAGVDWWQEGVFPPAESLDQLRSIVLRGPPRGRTG